MMYLGESFSIFCHCFLRYYYFLSLKTLYIALVGGAAKCARARQAENFQMKLPKISPTTEWRWIVGVGKKFRFSRAKVYFVFKVFLISMIYDSEAIKKRNGVSRYFLFLLPFLCFSCGSR
jgi:hypothetical protein